MNFDPIESPSERSANPACSWRQWTRRLLVCNPFFLCSAALLLFAVNQLSSDDQLFRGEIQNLIFNFSALQFYEVLVVVTAIILARRKIWYDSALLVVLEQGLVLVPFMLISQATMQGEAEREGLRLAWILSLAGGAVAIARYGAVRKGYAQFNLSGITLALGAAILAGNVALPLVFRPRMEKDVADWQEENLALWYLVLPLVAAGANLLRRPTRYGGLNPERHWLPLFIYGLWVAGSGVHVWSIAHICDLPLQLHHLAPVACALVWTLWNRISDFLPHPCFRWQCACLIATMLAPLIAFRESELFVALAGATHLAYLALWFWSTGNWPLRSLVKHLAIASLGLVVAGMPESWAGVMLANFSRGGCLVLAGCVVVIAQALRSARLELGLCGAVAVAVALSLKWRFVSPDHHVIAQFALVFLLLHSVRWMDRGPVPSGLRWLVALLWVNDAFLMTQNLRWQGMMFVAAMAVVVFGTWLIAGWHSGKRPSWALPLAAALTASSGPSNWLMRHSSEGLIALAGSFVLFALGIGLAWTRHRWEDKRKADTE